MSRLMAQDDSEVFRAVITIVRVGSRWTDGRHERTEVAGPYRTVGAAKGAIKRAERENTPWRSFRTEDREDVTVNGKVQRAAITWEDVE